MYLSRAFRVGFVAFLTGAICWAGTGAPVTVSPGTSAGSLIGATCPTFSWGTVGEAKSYELVVYRIGDQEEEQEPVLAEAIAGSALAWTPPLDRCLERGRRYAWSIRAVGDEKEISGWSVPSLFEVVAGPSEAEFEEAVTVVRQYLEGKRTGPTSGSAEGAEPSPSGVSGLPRDLPVGEDSFGPSPRSAAVGDSALQVNGSAVLTTATTGWMRELVAGQLCKTIDYRYVDRGDGSVLDCYTDLLWLKDANCFGPSTWDEAQSAAAGLADGQCGLTDGSQATDWRQPVIEELCSVPTSGETCPPASATASLINSNLSDPTVGNALGLQWTTDGDVFVGVQSERYWSARKDFPTGAWFVNLDDGFVGSNYFTGSLLHVWPVRNGP